VKIIQESPSSIGWGGSSQNQHEAGQKEPKIA
jgi:hypothetical protein